MIKKYRNQLSLRLFSGLVKNLSEIDKFMQAKVKSVHWF